MNHPHTQPNKLIKLSESSLKNIKNIVLSYYLTNLLSQQPETQNEDWQTTYRKRRKQRLQEVFRANIIEWFIPQIYYILHDIKHGSFTKHSDGYADAKANAKLFFFRNLPILTCVCFPLILIPIPGTAEIWLYIYCNFVEKTPHSIQKHISLKFQNREHFPPTQVWKKLAERVPRRPGRRRKNTKVTNS
jgi:hypothetical protein